MRTHSLLVFSAVIALSSLGLAQKKPLDHSVYDSWKTIRGTTFSADGNWIVYVVAPQEGDSQVEVKSLTDGRHYEFARGGTVQFSADSHFLVASIVPALADVKKAIKDKVAAADMPKNALLILNLADGKQTKIDTVTSFQLSKEDKGWLTYRPVPPKAATPAPAATGTAAPTRPAGGTRRGAGRAGGAGAAAPATGTPMVLRNLATGVEQKLENVGEALMPKDGSILVYTIISKEGKEDGVYVRDLAKGAVHALFKAKTKIAQIAVSDETKAVAFLAAATLPSPAKPAKPADDGEESEAEAPAAAPKPSKPADLALYFSPAGKDKAEVVVKTDTAGLTKGWVISDHGAITFSEKGSRVFFGSIPRPAEEKKDDTPDSEKVSVDIWNWQDKQIMPQQILQASAERNRSYMAAYTLATKKVLQLETETRQSVTVSARGEGKWALGSSDLNYRLQASWDADRSDESLIDMESGQSKFLLRKSEAHLTFSPDAKYLYAYDPVLRDYFVINLASRVTLRFKTGTLLFNEIEDTPSNPGAYGVAGWTKDDSQLLIYDAHDIWAIDPTGKSGPKNLTARTGLMSGTRLRYLNLDPEAHFIDLAKPILLSSFDPDSKKAAIFSFDAFKGVDSMVRLISGDKTYSSPVKSKTGNRIWFTQQDFVEFPDVWVAKADFSEAKKLSNANPQQTQYNWGTTELVNWISADGQRLQGILIKPENFSYDKKYPMITYFYERLSDSLNTYHSPAPSASTVNLTYFASNGYVMFVPDIAYKTGYPGESSLSAIIPGVLSIVNRGYVDPSRLGIQGQSWGGYEVAYLVTQSNLFKCACSGAAVADMFSAYGGIRYGTGILREGQYEHGQSRIGGSIWEKPLRYLENSPLFWLDKVETPLLMMQNDKDGAVPFTQGIELFSGLRRLGKPAWMVSYNGEDHNIVERKNRKDWTIRLSQFFDHYLMDQPMPVWMSKGVPATQKGKTMGLELEKPVPAKK